MKQSMIAAMMACALTGAADSIYTWDATNKVLSPNDGGVTVTCDGDTANIATFTANTAGDTISITGDPMTFATGATITLASSGTVSFAQKVTTLGATTLARGDDAYKVWTGSALSEGDPGICAFPDIVTNASISAADFASTWECIHVVAGVPNSNHNSRNHLNVGGRFDSIGGKIGSGEFVALNRVADSFV